MPHFRLLGPWFVAKPKALQDKSEEEVRRINEASQHYYEDPGRRGYWLNTPFSDPFAHWILYRFGFLLSAVRPLPCHRILDFGCGPGWASVMLAQMGCEVVGMDIAPGAVDLGNQRADQTLNPAQRQRCTFCSFSGFEIPFPDGHFDVVLIQEAIHHLPNPRTLFREWVRVLGLHGELAFAEPGLEHSEADISVQERDKGILEQDIELEQLYRTALDAGFRDLELLIPPVHPGHLMLPMSRARWFLRGLSWLVPANFLRHAMVTGPIGIFGKSPYSNPSVFPRSHRAELQSAASACQVRSSESFEISIRFKNISETVWLREGHHGIGCVRPAASLLDAEKRLLTRDFARGDLPGDVPPGESVSLKMRLTAPADPGSYVVRLDMVNEGITWFGDAGSRTMDVRLEVR
ncbi:MAG TPA: methyltransferase domain-containing protein [Acidobacteriota bacterium]|nr:methyltransferase domain-containing protein [Acidobacteriota bacterium]